MNVREVIDLITKDGWLQVRQKGSHRIYKHPEKPGIVVVPIHGMAKDVAPGTLNSILKMAGLKR